MNLVSSAAMSRIDERAQNEYGYPGLVLMENAGIRAADELERRLWGGEAPRRPVVLAGSGNNGGDALVMARQMRLRFGLEPLIILARERLNENAALHDNLCRQLGLRRLSWSAHRTAAEGALAEADFILDGLTGTGLDGPLRGAAEEIVRAANAAGAYRAAVDIPSGLGDSYRRGYPAFRADLTLTFGLPVTGLYHPAGRGFCGEIVVVPIGFPPPLLSDDTNPGRLLCDDEAAAFLPAFSEAAFKNRRGHAALWAGSPGYTGAAALSAEAAARSRCGLATLYTDPRSQDVLAAKMTSVMVKGMGERDAGAQYDAWIIGPGMGRHVDKGLLEALLREERGVLDADGLTLLSSLAEKPSLGGRWVLTPHPGEFCRLYGEGLTSALLLEEPVSYVTALSRRLDAVIVLKSHITWIGLPSGKFYVRDGGNPALGTAGSGDVLAGIIGGLMAAGLSPEKAACGGVLRHSLAGRLARSEKGWFLAPDLLPYLSRETL